MRGTDEILIKKVKKNSREEDDVGEEFYSFDLYELLLSGIYSTHDTGRSPATGARISPVGLLLLSLLLVSPPGPSSFIEFFLNALRVSDWRQNFACRPSSPVVASGFSPGPHRSSNFFERSKSQRLTPEFRP